MTFFRETTAVAGSPSVFLERDAELSALGQHLDAVGSGRAGIGVFVGGEAGVGKTALLREVALRRSPGVRLLSAGCEPLLAARPLGPFSDLGGELGALAELVDGRGTPYEVASCLLDQISGRIAANAPNRSGRGRRDRRHLKVLEPRDNLRDRRALALRPKDGPSSAAIGRVRCPVGG